MVTEQARWILTNTKVDPLLVAKAWGIEEQECWEYLVAFNQELNNQNNLRNETEVKNEAKDWANSLLEAYETKRNLLLERLRSAKTPEEKQERLIHYKLFTNKLDSLTPQQIERAKQYPLKDLIGTNKNITNCPFHDDRTASLNIKNNYFHCHGCGITGDTIKFLMEKDGLSFKEAVIKLQ